MGKEREKGGREREEGSEGGWSECQSDRGVDRGRKQERERERREGGEW